MFQLKKSSKWDSEFWIAFAVALVVVFVFSGFNRPLWIDEYLHFALAGLSFDQALDMMYATNSNVNHGQTWFYQVVSVGLLHVFGAGTLGLRALSWFATLVTLLSAFLLFRIFSVRPILQFLFLAGVVLIPTISFELGNSRSYILVLMTTALSTLGLFSTIVPVRMPKYTKLLFTIGVIVGALNHPYFPVVLLTLLVTLFLTRKLAFGEKVIATLEAVRFYVGVSFLSGLLSIFVGLFTWMRGSPDFDRMDPFYWLPIGIEIFVGSSLLFFIGTAGMLFFSIRRCKNRLLSPQLAAGLPLIVAGTGLSLLFSWISLIRNYWILPRQWLPGILLVLFGVILVAAHFLLINRPTSHNSKFMAARLGTLAVMTLVAIGISREIVQIQNNRGYWDELGLENLQASLGDPGEFYTIAGNLNIKCGGSVWQDHARFYEPMNSTKLALPKFTELYESCTID
jgi:hypothetical protein